MGLPEDARTSFHLGLQSYGQTGSIVQDFTRSYSGADYDQTWLSSGTTRTIQYMTFPIGPHDEQFVNQGLITRDDSKLFIHGSVTVQTEDVIVMGGSRFSVVETEPWKVSGLTIYNKVFARQWNGSPVQYI